MATIQIDIPAGADGTRVLNGLAGAFGYEPLISSGGSQITNPETKPVFVKRKVAELLKSMVLGYERSQAAKTANDTVDASAASLNIT